MKAKVIIMREQGVLRIPLRTASLEELWLKHERMPGEDRTLPTLRLLGKKQCILFDPRVTHVSAGTIRFMGMERVEQAWHVQEWSCDLVYIHAKD